MSAADGVALVWYHGGARPCWAYQTIARLWQTSPKGTVRSTARRTRLRAWPTRARSNPSDASGARTSTTLTGRVPNTAGHRQAKQATAARPPAHWEHRRDPSVRPEAAGRGVDLG